MKNVLGLLVVDVQNDFSPGGALGIRGGNEIIPVINRWVDKFISRGYPLFYSRDWHPEVTRHFAQYGGIWPVHCVANTVGAQFHKDLHIPAEAVVLSKGTNPNRDDYSAFQATTAEGETLEAVLRERSIEEIYLAGLATDYCIRETTLEALRLGFRVTVLVDACCGVDREQGDCDRALRKMEEEGARLRSQ